MNREQRRKFNKSHKTNFTRADFDAMIAYEKLKNGTLSLSDLQSLPANSYHMDNADLIPEGTPCKINYDRIKGRFDVNSEGYQESLQEWVEKHKDEEFHVTRESATNSCVCLKEQIDQAEQNNELKFLWDLYSDLLFKNENGEWSELLSVDPDSGSYLTIKK